MGVTEKQVLCSDLSRTLHSELEQQFSPSIELRRGREHFQNWHEDGHILKEQEIFGDEEIIDFSQPRSFLELGNPELMP